MTADTAMRKKILRIARTVARRNPLYDSVTTQGYIVGTHIWLLPPHQYADTGVSDGTCFHWGGHWYHRWGEPWTPGGLTEAHADVVARIEMRVAPSCPMPPVSGAEKAGGRDRRHEREIT